MSNESNPPKPRGCFFYGCLSVVIIGLIVIVLGALSYYLAKRTANAWINDFTDTAPAPIEQVEYSGKEMEALQSRLADFKNALDHGTNALEVIFSAADLNALIAGQKELRNKLFVRIEDSTVKGEISMPLQDIGPLKLDGRHLNATVTFQVALANGALDIRLKDAQVKSRPLPSLLLNELKKDNLAKNFNSDPKTAANIEKFESVRVTNGTVVLRNRLKAP